MVTSGGMLKSCTGSYLILMQDPPTTGSVCRFIQVSGKHNQKSDFFCPLNFTIINRKNKNYYFKNNTSLILLKI